jgi:hypothetical protein
VKRKPCGRAITSGPGLVLATKELAGDFWDKMETVDPKRCGLERAKGLQQCRWHWLLAQDAMTQAAYASRRVQAAQKIHPETRRARVAPAEWPEGHRWCAGCQSFVPLFYTSGSRCKGCASKATHAGMVERTYGITGEQYDRLFVLQDGRCYICRRKSKRRLAVDHDHVTGAVRGLLCPDPERGCNHAILGPLEASPGGALAAAKRMVDYLEDPPYARMMRGEISTVGGLEATPYDESDDPAPF